MGSKFGSSQKIRSLTRGLATIAFAAAFCFAPLVASAQDQQPPPPPPPNQQGGGNPNAGMPPEFAPPPGMAVPQTLTIPAGTVITVRLNDWLSSDHSQTGDAFGATLSRP